jgi:hypothetical protein
MISKIRRLTYFSINDEQEPEPREEVETTDLNIRDFKFLRNLSSKSLNKENPSSFKKTLIWLCGIEKYLAEANQGQKVQPKIDTSIDQDPFWKNFCDLNAVLCMGLCGFCYAFFNKFD